MEWEFLCVARVEIAVESETVPLIEQHRTTGVDAAGVHLENCELSGKGVHCIFAFIVGSCFILFESEDRERRTCLQSD